MFFRERLSAIKMKKKTSEVLMNKPIYIGLNTRIK